MPSNYLNGCEPLNKKYLFRIEDALLIHKIRYDRLDGTMKREERSKALDALKHDPRCEVLLVSLKAGGVGLNLTAAQRVILMDPCWYVSTLFFFSVFLRGLLTFRICIAKLDMILFCVLWVIYRNPAVENQAIDRIVSFHLFSNGRHTERNIISYVFLSALLQHRLGQTKPVSSTKFIISHSIEENMLKIQARKNRLADLTLGTRTKAELMGQRMEELQELFN